MLMSLVGDIVNGRFESFEELLFQLVLFGIGYAILFGLMLPVHEAAHAWAAVKLGDATPKWNGRLTLNPLAHLDPFGSLMILLFGIGYAKPVPINPFNFRNRRRDMALTALAGPVSNLLLAFISIVLFRVITLVCGLHITATEVVYMQEWQLIVYQIATVVFMGVLAPVNISLAVFNLLPLPPLDGSRIFGALLPERWTSWMDRYHQYVRLALLLVIVTGILDVPLGILQWVVGNGMCLLVGLPIMF